MSDPVQPQPVRLSPPSPLLRRRRSKWPWLVLILALAAGGAIWVSRDTTASSSAAKGNRPNQTVPVGIAGVDKGDIDIIDPALGTVTPLANVTVRTQINGVLQEVGFKEGQIVQKGDFLAQIDPRPYLMTLEQATGALQKDQALLKEAQLNLARYQKLLKQDSIAKQQVDTQESLVKQYDGAVASDQGQVDAANLDIAYCHITAPISGRVGLRQVDPGNYAQTSDANGLVTLTQLDPISVLFTLPEDQLPAVMKRLSTGTELPVTAFDRTNSTKLATGKLTAVDNQIDTSTGTVKLRAEFDNPAGVLFPNQFVNIQILVDTDHDVVIAPQAAILRGSPGTFVYLAKDDGTVAMTPVKVGPSQGDKVEITEGLSAGDKVVIDGTDKLRDGEKYKLPDATSGGPDKKSGGKADKADGGQSGKPVADKPAPAPATPADDKKSAKGHHYPNTI
ncbi:MAG: efflux RND transporter periplasmic adaptor subunit [Alphaproteobacteria bacterium]|nr:efflux RND transporter periplasmic adaptor subunit [Alphaproteobacteria bacterium]